MRDSHIDGMGPNSAESFIGGGCVNHIFESKSCGIASGWFNTIQGESLVQGDSFWNFIGGGRENVIASGESSVISGGWTNSIEFGAHSSIGGGWLNLIESADSAVIGGGYSNNILGSAYYATIGGRHENTILANGRWGTIPGGWRNTATNYAFAAGRRAKAIHTGAFVWADSTNADFASTASNQFLIRASGGVGINTNNPNGAALNVNGTVTATAFTGNGSGLTSLDAGGISSGSVADARLSANVALLNGSPSFSSQVSVGSGLRLNDANLWFRGGGDANHGLGWYGSGKSFGSSVPDGPVRSGSAAEFWARSAEGRTRSSPGPPRTSASA